MYTLDTNAIVYYLKGDKKVVSILDDIFSENFPIYISTITETELFSFSNLTEIEIKAINEILKTLSIIPLDSNLARLAGLVRSQYRIKTPDSIIAATALFSQTILVTRDIKDFEKIPQLKLLAI